MSSSYRQQKGKDKSQGTGELRTPNPIAQGGATLVYAAARAALRDEAVGEQGELACSLSLHVLCVRRGVAPLEPRGQPVSLAPSAAGFTEGAPTSSPLPVRGGFLCGSSRPRRALTRARLDRSSSLCCCSCGEKGRKELHSGAGEGTRPSASPPRTIRASSPWEACEGSCPLPSPGPRRAETRFPTSVCGINSPGSQREKLRAQVTRPKQVHRSGWARTPAAAGAAMEPRPRGPASGYRPSVLPSSTGASRTRSSRSPSRVPFS